MNPALLAKIGMGLMNGMGQGGADPAAGIGQLAGALWKRRRKPSEGAVLPNNPLMQPTGIGQFPMEPMMPPPPQIGEPGGPGGPVLLGGRRPRPVSRWGF